MNSNLGIALDAGIGAVLAPAIDDAMLFQFEKLGEQLYWQKQIDRIPLKYTEHVWTAEDEDEDEERTMTTEDPDNAVERARQALWLARKSLDETPAGGTIAPGLRGVYAYADRAHSAITLTGDIAAAHQAARDARAILTGAQIDVAALERWLGTHDGGQTIDEFVREIRGDLDEAVEALETARSGK